MSQGFEAALVQTPQENRVGVKEETHVSEVESTNKKNLPTAVSRATPLLLMPFCDELALITE